MEYYFPLNLNGLENVRGLTITASDAAIIRIAFVKEPEKGVPRQPPTELHREAARQLSAYFAGQLRNFDVPLQPGGTEFQQQVWAEIAAIPYGETRSYGEIGTRLGNPQLARAVGMGANRNPLPLMIPCHRVVGSKGALTGFAGGVEFKAFLLQLERRHYSGAG